MNATSLNGRRIALVISSLGAGGAERVIAELSRHWHAAGAQVTVIAFDCSSDPIYHQFDKHICFRRLCIANSGPGSAVRRIVALRAALRSERPDVAISFLTKINVLALAAGLGTDIPVVAAERNNPERQRAHWVWRLSLAVLYLRAAAVVCQTRDSVRCVPRWARGRAVVIPNPIAGPPGPDQQCAPPRLVAVGRLVAQKGFDLLIEAFALIARRHPSWLLDIWGEGPDRSELQAQIDERGLQARINLCGISPMPGGWAARADAFVLASRFEGFPNVLGEAMAAGLPVVAANCDFGPADLVSPDETGLLVAPDDVPALADGLDRLLGDKALRDRLGAAARRSAARFALEHVAAAWDRLLCDILLRRRGPTLSDVPFQRRLSVKSAGKPTIFKVSADRDRPRL